jgi:hypothetical protein
MGCADTLLLKQRSNVLNNAGRLRSDALLKVIP